MVSTVRTEVGLERAPVRRLPGGTLLKRRRWDEDCTVALLIWLGLCFLATFARLNDYFLWIDPQ